MPMGTKQMVYILRGGKFTAFEGGTKVPLIVSWPGKIEFWGHSDALISQVDFLASIMDLIGAELPKNVGFDSMNLSTTLVGEKKTGREHIVGQATGGLTIRKGKWKLIPDETRSSEGVNFKHNNRLNPISTDMLDEEDGNVLYNLDRDPSETHNIAAEHPDIVNDLNKLLKRIQETPERFLETNSQF